MNAFIILCMNEVLEITFSKNQSPEIALISVRNDLRTTFMYVLLLMGLRQNLVTLVLWCGVQ